MYKDIFKNEQFEGDQLFMVERALYFYVYMESFSLSVFFFFFSFFLFFLAPSQTYNILSITLREIIISYCCHLPFSLLLSPPCLIVVLTTISALGMLPLAFILIKLIV